jgi:ketosteroid isomerase-like protein
MDIETIARDVAALAGAGKDEEIAEKYWADSVVSIEKDESPMRVTRGKKEVHAKGTWFMENHTVHSVKCDGPYIHESQFALRLTYDLTPKASGQRMQMDEVALYTVKDGKIVEERFFMPIKGG